MTLRVADSIAESSSEPEAGRQLAAEEQVGRRVDVVGERERLVDRLDAERLGVARVADRRRACRRSGSRRESAGWAPDRTRISVDLPAPLPPTRPMTSPGVEVDGHVVARRGRRRTRRGCCASRRAACRLRATAAVPGGGDRLRSLLALIDAAPAGCRRCRGRPPTTSTMPTTMFWTGESTPQEPMPVGERLHDERRRGRRPGSSRCRRRTTCRRSPPPRSRTARSSAPTPSVAPLRRADGDRARLSGAQDAHQRRTSCMIVQRVLMPASSAASGLPPIGVDVAAEATPGGEDRHDDRHADQR